MINKISNEFILGLVLFTLPVSIAANSLSIILFILFFGIKYKTFSIKYLFVFSFSFLFFLIQIYAVLISHDKIIALDKFIPYLPFLVFPLGFSFILKNKIRIDLDKSFLYLIYGVFCILFYGIIRTVIDVLINHERFDYGRGGEIMLKYTPHHVYLGVFILSTILLISYLFSKEKINKLMLLTIPFLYLILFILPSRIILLISIVLLPIIIFTYIRKRLSTKHVILVFTIILSTIVISFSLFDYSRHKITHMYYNLTNQKKEKTFNGIDDRKKIWSSSIQLIKEKPFVGFGLGDTQKELNSIYNKNGFNAVINKNTHNQYLQFILYFGIPLTILLSILLIKLLLKLLKTKSYFYIISIFIFLLVFLTESLLNRQLGIVYISLFMVLSKYSLLIKNYEIN